MLRFLEGLISLWWLWIKTVFLYWVPLSFRKKKCVKNEVVLITGGGNGLGRLLSLTFARLGARVVIWDVDVAGARGTCQMIEKLNLEPAVFYKCNIASNNEVKLTAARVKQEVGSVQILINNAGILVGKYLPDLTEKEIEQVFKVNILSHFWTCKAFLPDMKTANHGHVVSLASAAGLGGVEKLSDYCATKHAVVGFHESVSRELRYGGHDGVKMTIVCPTFFRSGLFQGLGKQRAEVSPETVSESVMNGILTDQELVLVPGSINLLLAYKALVPTAVYMKALDLAKTGRLLRNFRGARDIDFGDEVDDA